MIGRIQTTVATAFLLAHGFKIADEVGSADTAFIGVDTTLVVCGTALTRQFKGTYRFQHIDFNLSISTDHVQARS